MSLAFLKDGLKKNTMILALIAVVIFFAVQTDGNILLPQNISNFIPQNSYVVILAVGMLLCILTGGNIDLSVGSVVCLVGAIAGKLIVEANINMWLAMLLSLCVGALIGVWQGFWIAYIRIPPFIVTLAGMLIWRGIALIILDGKTVSPMPDQYNKLFNGYFPNPELPFLPGFNLTFLIGILISILVAAVILLKRVKKIKSGYGQEGNGVTELVIDIGKVVAISAVVISFFFKLDGRNGIPFIFVLLCVIVAGYTYYTSKTVPGRYYYAVGGNEKAAKMSGINTSKVYFIAYVNMAVLASIAALVCNARFNSAAPTVGMNYELDAIGACFIGGASAYGGIGTVPGVIIGAVFMGVLNMGMSIMGLDANWQKAVKGMVLLIAVIFDVLSKKKAKA